MAKQDSSPIKDLKNTFPIDSWSWIIPALRRDPLVWDMLCDPTFRAQAVEVHGDLTVNWSPLGLGVLAVNQQHSPGIPWPLTSFDDLPADLMQMVYQRYQDQGPDKSRSQTLAESCLSSLALWAEHEAGKPWSAVLPPIDGSAAQLTELSCLWNLAGFDLELLKVIPPSTGIRLLLSQVLPEQQIKEYLVKHLLEAELKVQLCWLQDLKKENPEMTIQVARSLTPKLDREPKTLEVSLGQIALFHMADQQQEALQLIDRAAVIQENLKAELITRKNTLQVNFQQPQLTNDSWKELKNIASTSSSLVENAQRIVSLMEALLEKEYFAAIENLVEILPQPYPNHPGLLTILAVVAYQQEAPSRARELAKQALDQIDEQHPAPARLARLLLDLNMPEESIQAAESTLKDTPFHLSTLVTLADSLDRRGNHSKAVEHAQLAVVTSPGEVNLHRQLANYLEKSEKWDDALQERSLVLAELQKDPQAKATGTPHLPPEDLHAIANCAYHAGQPQRAVSACQNILDLNPQDAIAHTTIGKSLASMGETEQGYEHLHQATKISPDIQEPWLSLADIKIQTQNFEDAIHTLEQGTNASSEQAKIYLKLGQIQRSQSTHSAALKSFQKAAKLLDSEDVDQKSAYQIQYELGQALYTLGHLQEARQTIKDLHNRFPGNQQANTIYGKILLELGEPRSALPYLAKVVENQPQDAQPYLLYADAHLQIGANPKFAVQALTRALELDPENQMGLALQGEAQAAHGNHTSALASFQKALDSSLSSDKVWGPRIILGFGKAALALDQTETAVATLKEGWNKNPNYLPLARGLAEAYLQADLTSLALNTARQSFEAAPQDLNNLAWTADFALKAGSAKDAIPALERIMEIDPQDVSAYLQLGKAHHRQGNPDLASKTLAKISDLDDAEPEDLYQSGDKLLKLGDLPNGMKALKKAANICQANPSLEGLLPKIWAKLAVGYEMNGDPNHAINLLDKAIAAQLNEPGWRVQKADLLIRLHRFQAALASMENALELVPDHPAYHYKLGIIHRKVTDYQTALYHAQAAVKGFQYQEERNDEDYVQAVDLAAHLAAGNLQLELAGEIAYSYPLEHTEGDLPDRTQLLCLQAELALDQNQEVEAAEIINNLVKNQEYHPRVLALQSRMQVRQGNVEDAQSSLEKALAFHHKDKGHHPIFPSSVPLTIGKAAQDLQSWKIAVNCYSSAVDAAPNEPRSQNILAQSLVLQAEFTQLSTALKVSRHAQPGSMSREDDAEKFQLAISSLEDLGGDAQLISKWEARGQAAFNPNQDTTRKLDEVAVELDDLGALIAIYRANRQLDQAAKIAQELYDDLGQNTFLDAQIALVNLKTNPTTARQAAECALNGSREEYPTQTPLFQVLQALTAAHQGDKEVAYQSISSALDRWDDEPRWHALAASFADSPQLAVEHLETALALEPDHPSHYLALGKTYIQNNEMDRAVSVLEEGLKLTPEHTEIWLTLASTYQMKGNYQQAFQCAAQAVQISPDHTAARKTAAELAYRMNNFTEAERHLGVLLENDLQDPESLHLLSLTLAAQNQPEEALQITDKAIAHENHSLEMELHRAELLKEIEGPHAAVDALRVINSQHPENFNIILSLVKTLTEAGETDQAIAAAQDALHQEELGHTRDQKAELHLLTGRLLHKTGHLDQAVHHLHQSKKLAGNSSQSYLELGCIHHDRRQHDQALEDFLKAIEIDPNEPLAYYHAGRVLKDLKEFGRAENMLRQASKLAPNDLRIHRQLGVLVTLNLVHGEPKKVEAFT